MNEVNSSFISKILSFLPIFGNFFFKIKEIFNLIESFYSFAKFKFMTHLCFLKSGKYCN